MELIRIGGVDESLTTETIDEAVASYEGASADVEVTAQRFATS